MEHSQKLDLAIGGQALIEGVMIRSPSWVAIAVRKPDGSIIVKKDPFKSLTTRIKVFKLPVVRGIVTVMETMVLGMKALNFSAEQALGEEEKDPKKTDEGTLDRRKSLANAASFALSIVISIVFAIFLFKFIPLFLTEQLRKIFPALANSGILFNVVDGLIRVIIFFGYLFILSLFASFRRVFQYHGAEHMSVFAYEKGHELTPANVEKESPRHPRCGTSFIIIVLIVSILLLILVPRHPVFWLNFLRRLAIVPLIMGLGYEVLKWTAKHRAHPLVRLLTYPGILTQYITTKKPDLGQIEVALAATKAAVEAETEMSLRTQ